MVLKTEEQIRKWLTEKNFFEWTTVTAKQEPNNGLKITTRFDDTKAKLAGEKYNQWDVEFLIKSFKEIYTLFNHWDIEKQENIIIKSNLDINEYIEKINKSKQISIKPKDNIYGIYFDDWMSDASSIIEGGEIHILRDICKEQTVTPRLSDRYISFTYLNEDFPNSKFWINELEKEGIKSSYIEYFLNPVDIAEVPEYDYDKWSIRPLIEKGNYPFGVNICSIERNELTKRLTLDLQEDKLIDFFEKIKIVASKKPLVEVKCGNVLFTDSEWRQYLMKKIML